MDKKKILVVDDETDFLEMIKLRLEASGYEVDTAIDGEEGLRKVKEGKPSAILLDILMPKVDGLTALERIRKTDKNVPVFMITAFSNEERFKTANKFNASGFIVKTSDLKKEIENITTAIRLAERFKG